MYPLKSLYGAEHQFNWINQHKMYKEWLCSYGPSILHVQGTTGASTASEYIFQCLKDNKKKDEISVYFSFNRCDDRSNSVAAMLNSFLAQIFSQHQEAMMFRYEQLSFHKSWTQAGLLHFFREVILNWNHGGLLCVIDNIDECDDSGKAFLNDLRDFAGFTEVRFKIVIISTSELRVALADQPEINLDEGPLNSKISREELALDIGLKVTALVQQRPEFMSFERFIIGKLIECGRDKHWRDLVLKQLTLSNSPSTKTAIRRELDALPPTTLRELIAQILTRVPFETRRWARTALSWILYSFQPLTIWELGVALALDVNTEFDNTANFEDHYYQNVIADLDKVFGGLFVLRHNEVHFGHPNLQLLLQSADGGQENVWYDVKETAHQEISDSCLMYLSAQQVQYSVMMCYEDPPAEVPKPPISISPCSLHAYAIKYWPRHYKLIPESFRPTASALHFAQNIKVMRSWSQAYWWSSNPIVRTDRAFLSFLPIFAGLGLQDLVAKWLKIDAQAPAANSDRALALAEAARYAHIEVLRSLLVCGGYDQASLQDALIAGASCGGEHVSNELVLNELVEYAAKSSKNFPWPPAIPCRAARFGFESVVKKLLASGASLDTAISPHGMTPMHFAAHHGHAGVVRILLEHKTNISALSSEDGLPLHSAAFKGNAVIAKLLLDAGADVNALNAEMITAIYRACAKGHYKVVEILTNAGCDMGCNEQGDWSSLTIVAAKGFIKCARFLLEKNANTEVRGPNNFTPLRYAVVGGHLEFCRLLLQNGADANTIHGGGAILLETASQGNLEIAKALIDHGADVNAVNSEGWTALHEASVRGHLAFVTHLLDKGAHINRRNELGHSSILLAAQAGFVELVQLLINRGADLHSATKDGLTPINSAYDYPETTRILLQHGAKVDNIWKGSTPLHLSASYNHIQVVKVLLSYSPDLETPYSGDLFEKGCTALTIATVQGHADVLRLLLEAGANVNHQHGAKRSILQCAVECDREDIVSTLMEYGPHLDLVNDHGDTALNCLGPRTSLAIAMRLINGGSGIETQNNMGQTPLCRAVQWENFSIVNYLITKKAEINMISKSHGGPLHIACRWANLDLVKTLVAAGADVNLIDPSAAGTPLQSACRCWDPSDHEEAQENIIQYLIGAKADVAIVGGLQGCALNAACGWATPKMVKLFLDKGAKVYIADRMGRSAVHFSAKHGLEHLHKILEAGADIEARDKMGRTVLHHAVIGGLIDVVERVLFLSSSFLDQADYDGWTPLLWAARGCGTYHQPATSSMQMQIIKLLLDRGANPCVIGKGLNRDWSPVRIARYHRVDEEIVQLLIAKAKEKLAEKKDVWDEDFHESERALNQNPRFCDSCLCIIYGIRYHCMTCSNFDFCQKCYLSRNVTDPGHIFRSIGPEYEPFDEISQENSPIDDSADDDSMGDDDSEEDDAGSGASN